MFHVDMNNLNVTMLHIDIIYLAFILYLRDKIIFFVHVYHIGESKINLISIFSSLEHKAHASLSDYLSSILPSVCKLFTISFSFHRFLFVIFSRTTGPISTKLCAKHSYMKGMQVTKPFQCGKIWHSLNC